MLSKELEFALNLAYRKAVANCHPEMSVEHLLLSLIDNTNAAKLLLDLGVNLRSLKSNISAYIQKTYNIYNDGEDDSSISKKDVFMNSDELNFSSVHKDKLKNTSPSIEYHKVLQKAIINVQSLGVQEVNGAHVLSALFSEENSYAVKLLHKVNVDYEKVMEYIINTEIKHNHNKFTDKNNKNEINSNNSLNARFIKNIEECKNEDEDSSLIHTYTVNLNEKAKKGLITSVVGREDEFKRMNQTLCRFHKNNPLLIGDVGVGKTAIAEGLALRIIQNKVPKPLAKSTIYALDLGYLISGTKYRGDFEKRFKSLLLQLSNQENAILFIDEIHTIIGAGVASGGLIDAANLLKPALISNKLRCIGAIDWKGYNIFEKEHSLNRRFQQIEILEPTNKAAYKILQSLKSELEQHHNVQYTDQAISSAITLSQRYLHNRSLPDKAIDIIDEAGAAQIKNKKQVDKRDIENVVARMSKVPNDAISKTEGDVLHGLADDLKNIIIGQDAAIEKLISAIQISRAGINNTAKPTGTFLFAGPTGVGKTEVAKQLSKHLGVELLRFDMSEYMEAHSISRLIGSPPGYVGFEQNGLLTDKINKNPYAVLLFDELEKAHGDIFNILLQIMDYGVLTDNNGQEAIFRHAIIVMTTNAGAIDLARNTIGFVQQDQNTDSNMTLQKMFSPEFRNRLDGIVKFNSLTEQDIVKITAKFMNEFRESLATKKINLHITDEALQWFAHNGYSKVMGARPMHRLIHNQLKKYIAQEILFGVLQNGGDVYVSQNKDNTIKIDYNDN